MFDSWAADPTLICVAFLFPAIVNLSVLLGVMAASRFHRVKCVMAITGAGVQLFTLYIAAKLAVTALMVEMTTPENTFYLTYFIVGAGLFIWSLYILAEALGNRGDSDGWDDDSDDDDGPDPDSPLPVGPSSGLTLQTSSSQRLQNNHAVCATIFPVRVESCGKECSLA